MKIRSFLNRLFLSPFGLFLLIGCSILPYGQKDEQLTIALPGEMTFLDPINTGNVNSTVVRNIYETLFINKTNSASPLPFLAKNYKFTPILGGSTALRINLREDSYFHDGSPLTAADVYFSLMRLMSIKNEIPLNFTFIKEIFIISKFSIELIIKENTPLEMVLFYLSLPETSIIKETILTNNLFPLPMSKLIGSGPYHPQFDNRNLLMLTPNFFYKQKNKQYFKKIFIFKNFKYDKSFKPDIYIGHNIYNQYEKIETTEDKTIHTRRIFEQYKNAAMPFKIPIFMGFNLNKEPYNQVEFRNALAQSIDRSAFNFCQARCVAPRSNFYPFTTDKMAPVWSYDPENAAIVLKKYLKNKPLEIYTDSPAALISMGNIIKQQLAKQNIQVKVIPLNSYEFLQAIKNGAMGIFLRANGYTNPQAQNQLFFGASWSENLKSFEEISDEDEDELITTRTQTPTIQEQNILNINEPYIQSLMSASSDPKITNKQKMDIYSQIHNYVNKNSFVIVLGETNLDLFHSQFIKNIPENIFYLDFLSIRKKTFQQKRIPIDFHQDYTKKMHRQRDYSRKPL